MHIVRRTFHGLSMTTLGSRTCQKSLIQRRTWFSFFCSYKTFDSLNFKFCSMQRNEIRVLLVLSAGTCSFLISCSVISSLLSLEFSLWNKFLCWNISAYDKIPCAKSSQNLAYDFQLLQPCLNRSTPPKKLFSRKFLCMSIRHEINALT